MPGVDEMQGKRRLVLQGNACSDHKAERGISQVTYGDGEHGEARAGVPKGEGGRG